MRRDIFYRPQTMKFEGCDYRDDAMHFDPEFPKGVKTVSKPLTNWDLGEPDWKRRDDAIVTPGGRKTERTPREESPPFFGIGILTKRRR